MGPDTLHRGRAGSRTPAGPPDCAISPVSATSSPARRCPAPCRRGRTRRRRRRAASIPSSCRAPPFTAPRAENRRSWLYRIRPSAMHRPFRRIDDGLLRTAPCARGRAVAQPAALEPAAVSRTSPTDFVDGPDRRSAATAMPRARSGIGVHLYRATRSMTDRVFYDADGELLIVPQQGRLLLRTEFGVLDAAPGEIAVVPRGVKFRVELPDGRAARLCLRELRRAVPPARARADRRQRARQPARFPDARSPPSRTATARRELVAKFEGHLWATDARPLAARRRRLARQLRAVQIRPRPLQHDRHGQLRPSRPVDLHRADLAERDAGHRQLRLRDLPAALDGRRAHLPAAVLPPQRDERVHGAGARRL